MPCDPPLTSLRLDCRVVTPALALIIFVAGAVAGGLGALLGLGGGIFLVPFLNLGLQLPVHGRRGHQPHDRHRHVELGVGRRAPASS